VLARARWKHGLTLPSLTTFPALARQLADIGRHCYERGWALGTSGNFSAVVSKEPLTLAITTSSVDKGLLEPAHIVAIDEGRRVLHGSGTPSAEAALHLAIVRSRGAGAVLHTHSVWSTILSEATTDGSLAIEGYEMLKGLDGVRSHEHRERLPIVENTQNWAAAAPQIEAMLREHPEAHGFLIRGHGLYTWGKDLAEAKRQIEILEFLFEVMGRKRGVAWQQ
jgi:methylthioribulose-1-phosphate dehydratase